MKLISETITAGLQIACSESVLVIMHNSHVDLGAVVDRSKDNIFLKSVVDPLWCAAHSQVSGRTDSRTNIR